MTAVPARASAATVARWVEQLRHHTAAAEETRAKRDSHYHRLERQHAGDQGGLTTAVRDDPDLPTLAWLLAEHRADAALAYQAIAGEYMGRQLLQDPGPRPVAPAAPGVRPGTGPSLQVGTGLIGAAPSGRRGEVSAVENFEGVWS